MLDEFNVRDNKWLESISEIKKKWANAYFRWSWSGGMRSTQNLMKVLMQT